MTADRIHADPSELARLRIRVLLGLAAALFLLGCSGQMHEVGRGQGDSVQPLSPWPITWRSDAVAEAKAYKQVLIAATDEATRAPVVGALIWAAYFEDDSPEPALVPWIKGPPDAASNRFDRALTDTNGMVRLWVKPNERLMVELRIRNAEFQMDSGRTLSEREQQELQSRPRGFAPQMPDIIFAVPRANDTERESIKVKAERAKREQEAADLEGVLKFGRSGDRAYKNPPFRTFPVAPRALPRRPVVFQNTLLDSHGPVYWPQFDRIVPPTPKMQTERLLLMKRWENAKRTALGTSTDLKAIRTTVLHSPVMRNPHPRIDEIRWLSRNLVMVEGGWQASSLGASSYYFVLERRGRKWAMIAQYLGVIS